MRPNKSRLHLLVMACVSALHACTGHAEPVPATGGNATNGIRVVTISDKSRDKHFEEYDARRKETLEKMAQGKDLNGALARLYLNKDVETANRIIMEADLGHWTDHIPQFALYKMFNAGTGNRAKLLSRAATDKLHDHMWECFQPKHGKGPWGCCRHHYPLFVGGHWGNQNHGFVFQSWFYMAATTLKDIPKYADQFDQKKHIFFLQGWPIEGMTPLTMAAYAEGLHQLWRDRPLFMAKQGVWAEDQVYRCYSVASTYNLAYHADDPDIRRRAAMILDLHWLIYALHMVDGQLGGAMNRFKEGYETYHFDRGLGQYYFGGEGFGFHSTEVALLGDYVPPDIAYDLMADPKKRGCFVYRERVNQFSESGPPTYKYSYVTPEYVVGSYIAHDLTKGPGRYAERAFNGVTFGKARAMLRLEPVASWEGCRYMQNGPILLASGDGKVGGPFAAITQREKGGVPVKPATIEGGWVFGEAGDAYFAIRPAEGQCATDAKGVTWPDAKIPLVIHVGGATEDGSFDAFKKKILANRLAYKDGTLVYEDAKWGKMEFCPDAARPAEQWRRINGEPVALPDKLFDSPYLTSDYNSGIVKAQFNGRTLTLNFNTGETTEE